MYCVAVPCFQYGHGGVVVEYIQFGAEGVNNFGYDYAGVHDTGCVEYYDNRIVQEVEAVPPERKMEEFMDNCSMVKTDSPFRGTFVGYLESEVPHAVYLEGMRVAFLGQDIEKAIKIMAPMGKKSLNAGLAIPILKICSGQYYVAMNDMYEFWKRAKTFEMADSVGSSIVRHIAQLAPATIETFSNKWSYLYVPQCATHGHRCKNCLLYSYARLVRGMV